MRLRPVPRALATLALAALVGAGCGPNRTHPTRLRWDADAAVPPLGCVPNLDGRIDAPELAPVFGVPVSTLISPPGELREVDLVGAPLGDGARRWDLGTDFASDSVASAAASPIDGRWYAGSFAADTFVVPTDPSGLVEAVYRAADDGLYLLGLASREADPPEGRTLLVYATPILLFRLPLEVGASWLSVGEVSGGTLRGLPYAGRDTYEGAVVASGELVLPDVTFTQALRVATRITISPSAGAPVSRQQTTFLFECFGEVARVVGRDDEPAADFTLAAEMRRFGL